MFRFSFSGTRNIIFGTLKIGQNDPEIPNLEFESHGFLQNHVYLPTEQAETNICWIIYQDATFKICLSLFGWKVNIVPKMHIVHWCPEIFENIFLKHLFHIFHEHVFILFIKFVSSKNVKFLTSFNAPKSFSLVMIHCFLKTWWQFFTQ